jgi:hypothetical protein
MRYIILFIIIAFFQLGFGQNISINKIDNEIVISVDDTFCVKKNLFISKNPPADDYYCGDKSCLLKGFRTVIYDNIDDSIFIVNIDTLAADSIYWLYFETLLSDCSYKYPFFIRYQRSVDEEFQDTLLLPQWYPNVLFTYLSDLPLLRTHLYLGRYRNLSGIRLAYWFALIPNIKDYNPTPLNGCQPQFFFYTEYHELYRFCELRYLPD